MLRPLSQIANEISVKWPNVSPHANPYLDAMMTLNSITDMFVCDDGRSIVLYFLANANTWRGDDARRIKDELRLMLR